MPQPPRNRRDFTVAIICALDIEASAVLDTFDVNWSDRGHRYGRAPADDNTYTTGAVGEHNVVLVHMPGMGVTHASNAATNLRHSFPDIQLALVVGICGGVPSGPHHKEEIYLGDLIISTAVVQYDFGRQHPTGFERKRTLEDTLGHPNRRISGLLVKLKTQHYLKEIGKSIVAGLDLMRTDNTSHLFPSSETDYLYESTYLHKHQSFSDTVSCAECSNQPDGICKSAVESSCDKLQCNPDRRVHRPRPPDRAKCPRIHLGKIGSGNAVIKSGQHRDWMSTQDGLIAFEMEGAGVWDALPTVVIKGVCDYADSHKSKVWQIHAAMVAALGAKAIITYFEAEQTMASEVLLEVHKVDSKPQLPCHWLVPFTRDRDFVARSDIIQQIDNHFQDMTYSPRVALVGLGGVGKSQIAIEYGHHIKDCISTISVFWVNCSNKSRFNASYQSISRVAKVPGYDDPKIDQTDSVCQWLQSDQSGQWLLILDNVDDIALLQPAQDFGDTDFSIIRYLPRRDRSAVLVTSRDYQVAATLAGQADQVIPVSVMSLSEAQQLARSKIPVNRGNENDRSSLCQMLDCLPLAITQAAAYIARSITMTITKYITLFNGDEQNSMRLLTDSNIDFRRDWQVPHSVARTWEISFAQIQSRQPRAADLLSLMAIFDRQAVPKFLFQRSPSDEELEDAIEMLLSYAFIVVDTSGTNFSTHRLVQLATRSWLDKMHTRLFWQERALILLALKYPNGRFENWAICQVLEPHADCALQSNFSTDDAELILATLLYRRAWYHDTKRNLISARNLIQRCIEIRVRILGETAIETIHSKSDLAEILRRQGHYEQAEEMFRQLLKVLQTAEQPEPYSLYQNMQRLARVLIRMKTIADAEVLQRQCLAFYAASFGPDHRYTLSAMHDLSRTLAAQDQLDEAEKMHRTILVGYEKSLGREHPYALRAIAGLARVLSRQGKLEQSELLWRQVIDVRRRVFGPEHPETLTSMQNLAHTLHRGGKHAEARYIHRETLQVRRRVLGMEHPDTISGVYGLALVLLENGEKLEACQLYQELCLVFVRLYGFDHERTRELQNAIAHLGSAGDEPNGGQDEASRSQTISSAEEPSVNMSLEAE